jgi:hypothetical protein
VFVNNRVALNGQARIHQPGLEDLAGLFADDVNVVVMIEAKSIAFGVAPYGQSIGYSLKPALTL